MAVPPACRRGVGARAIAAAGGRDPVPALYVTPRERVRREWPVPRFPGAGHLDCTQKAEFRQSFEAWLDRQ